MRSSEISIAVRPESKIKYPITTRFDGVHFDIRHFIFFYSKRNDPGADE
jgi:hypothetical protein